MSGNPSLLRSPANLAIGRADRRSALRAAGLAALGASVTSLFAGPAHAANPFPGVRMLSDHTVLNFALNLEYLEAEFYLRAVRGRGLDPEDIGGVGEQGPVIGGREVPFETEAVRQYALEIASDEAAHVRFLRSALGDAAVARPLIDLDSSFTTAAQAAGLIGPDETFDAFANETNFLIAAFIFEDVGVTAYKGAVRFIRNRDFLEAAAGILAVEGYHASNIRTVLFARDVIVPPNQISDARDSLGGPEDLDQGITRSDAEQVRANIVPSDDNGLAFSRTPAQVLNIVYLNPADPVPPPGGFFPNGLNGFLS